VIQIKNIQTIDNKKINLEISSNENQTINADGLTLLPALIDPHVHFRTPGWEHKEDWRSAAQASVCGGYTTVFDMPNTQPPTVTAELLREKKQLIDAQLKEVGIPLRYQLFFGADKNHLAEIPKVKNDVVGIKIFMGCSTGNLVIDDDESLRKVFALAAENNLLVAVHAEDEELMKLNQKKIRAARASKRCSISNEPLPCGRGSEAITDKLLNYSDHSLIRNEEVAMRAVAKAISLTKQYGTRLYILHTSTEGEMNLIRNAKQQGLPVFAEVCPHHLFLAETSYEKLKGKAVMNPPLRAEHHHAALWQAIHDGTIDTIGSDHAPHLLAEKEKPYGACPSGVPGIETTLPLLLNAHHAGLLSLQEIVALTFANAKKIFNLKNNDDVVLVNLNKQKIVAEKQLKTKCGWSPFTGMQLTGWPVYTILQGKVFNLGEI
jgi:dihydroorotase